MATTDTTKPADLPVLAFPDAAALEAWLAEHHESSPGIWLRLAKKGSGIPSVTQAEAVELGLRHGWIDGQGRREDDVWWRLRFTPRRPRSIWSKRNREAATALIAAGRMTPKGLREVETAKADGRWDAAYDGPATATVPDDLREALAADDRARAFFATLDSQNRYAILHRIQTARKPETRQRTIKRFVAMLAAGEKLYP